MCLFFSHSFWLRLRLKSDHMPNYVALFVFGRGLAANLNLNHSVMLDCLGIYGDHSTIRRNTLQTAVCLSLQFAQTRAYHSQIDNRAERIGYSAIASYATLCDPTRSRMKRKSKFKIMNKSKMKGKKETKTQTIDARQQSPTLCLCLLCRTIECTKYN